MPKIGSGGYAEVYHPPRSIADIPRKYRDNEAYVQRYTMQSLEDIHFGEKARRIFDPTDSISLPILYMIEQPHHMYSEIFRFRKGNLREFLRGATYVGLSTIIASLVAILKGLVRLHNKRIIHHDIKIENILYDMKPKFRLFLIDWGTACHYKDVFGPKYDYWLPGDNENHPPEYKIMARHRYNYQYTDIVEEYSKNSYYTHLFKRIQPDYDVLLRRADREIRRELKKHPRMLEDLAGKVDVFAMGIVFCQAIGGGYEFHRYMPLLRGMIHPDPRKRWTIGQCIRYLEKK